MDAPVDEAEALPRALERQLRAAIAFLQRVDLELGGLLGQVLDRERGFALASPARRARGTSHHRCRAPEARTTKGSGGARVDVADREKLYEVMDGR